MNYIAARRLTRSANARFDAAYTMMPRAILAVAHAL